MMVNSPSGDDSPIGIKALLFWLCLIGIVIISFISAFHLGQSIQLELNYVTGVLVVAAVLLLIFE